MTRLILFRLVFPVLAYIAVVVLAITYIPTDYPNSRDAIALIGLVLIVAGWGLVFARWLHSIRWLKVVAYVLAHLLLSCTIFATILLIGYGFQRVSSVVPAIFSLLSVVLAFSWWLGSLIHLIRHGKRYPYRSIWWRVLLVRAPKETEPTPRTEHAIYGSPSTLPPLHQSSQQMSHAPQTRPYLFQAVSFGRDESPAAGVRIPARDDHPAQAADSRRNKPKSSRPTTERLPLSLEIKVPDPNSGFIKQAHRYASRTQTRSSFVPFQQYWPTYADMTRQQQEWYFYWRTQLRNDQPLPTDTSYLFVHAYELINVIGAPSSQAALDQLVRLWKCYRQEHPKLDSYLVDWIADFLVVHCLSVQPLDWYAQALQVGAYVRRNEDLFLEAWLRNGADIEDLDIDLLYRISDYSPKRSKFYKTHERVFDFDRAFKLGVSAVNSYLRQHHEPGLFQADDGAQRYWITRSPFASAIHGYVLGEIKIAQVRSWIDNTALGAIIGSIIRQTENILRKELNYRAQLRGISTPKAWEDAIRAAIVTPTPKREVEIDLAHAELIRQQSEAIRRRLIVEDEQYAPDISLEIDSSKPQINENAAAPDQPTEFAETSQKRLLHSSVIQRPTDAPDGLLTDLSAIGKLMGEPDSEQAKLLSVLRKKNWQAPPAILGEQFEHAFVNVIFDRINEAAFEVLGSALLFDEAGQWVVAEDYRDEIAYILDHPDYRSNNESSPAEAKNLFGESYRLSAELDMGWIEFAQHLQSHHWSALAILIKGIDVKSKLNAVASVTLTTANQLVDDINEVALERLSDTVIDASTEPPSVIEEYQESVDALVQWAIQNQRAETT